MLKSELRRLVRQRKGQFTQQQLCELSLPIVERIRPLVADAKTIVAYYSLPDEVYTHDFINELTAQGKTVYLPRVVSDEDMVLCRYTGADSLKEGAYGIMEPIVREIPEGEKIDVVLVPGMAFDGDGNRLGRGKGYYDRFLKALSTPRPKLLGVCFDFQKVDTVPVGRYDVPVDLVV